MLQASVDPYRFKLKRELQERLDQELCTIVQETVQSSQDRDSDLKSYRWQLEGYSQPAGNLPWPGACELEDTISRELHTTLTSAIWSAAKQVPYICLEPVSTQDIDAASNVETWINIKAQQYGYEQALYNAIYLALEGRYAPLYIGFDQDITRSFELRSPSPQDEANPEVIPPEPEVLLSEVPGERKIEFRAPNPWDFYVYPVTARGPQVDDGCSLLFERMWLSKEDLLMGVIEQGYDREAVEELIRLGPAKVNVDDNDDAERDGLSEVGTNSSAAQLWECFQAVGRSPLLENDTGVPQVPDALLHSDCVWLVCAAHKIVLKQGYSPFPDGIRPYAIFNMVAKPNRIYGEGIVSMLSAVQDEMTSILRFGINNMNLEASPVMVVAESWLTRYSKWTIAPGRNLPRMSSDPVGPRPLTWDIKSQGLIMPWLQLLDGRAQRIAASQGSNTMLANRQQKAAAIHFAEQMQQTKFDLFLSNIQRGVKETFRIMMAILMKNIPAPGDTAVSSSGQSVHVTTEDLEKKFRFLPQASTDSISPAARLARQQVIAQIVTTSPMYKLALQQGDLSFAYALTHRLLVLAGERSPERYIGPEPPGGSQQGNPLAALLSQVQSGQSGAGAAIGPTVSGYGEQEGGGLLQASSFGANGASEQ